MSAETKVVRTIDIPLPQKIEIPDRVESPAEVPITVRELVPATIRRYNAR
jgi:hypothetical protein